MRTYREIESACEASFRRGGPFWHLYTSGKEATIIFKSIEDHEVAMNLLAMTAFKNPGIIILAFEIMDNHVHFALSGSKDCCITFFWQFRRRLMRYFSGKGERLSSFDPKIKEITDLRTLRNTIVYINRNGYVADNNYTPFSYPWGTGGYYFNVSSHFSTYGQLTAREKRALCKSRNYDLPDNFKLINNYIVPISYCGIKFGMSLFSDAHNYFSLLTKNVEAYNEMAEELGDYIFLTDSEMMTEVLKICKREYSGTSFRLLRHDQLRDLAKKMHYDLKASNEQIRRILGLERHTVNEMFPLSVKR